MNVTRDEQVQATVAIVITKSSPGRPGSDLNIRFGSYIAECAVVIVVVKPILAKIR